jgi:uncharacterized protein
MPAGQLPLGPLPTGPLSTGPRSTGPLSTAAFVGFARLLRERGLRLTPTEIGHFQAAVGLLPAGDLTHMYWAGRVCLAVQPGYVDDYDDVFARYFLGTVPGPAAPQQPEKSRPEPSDTGAPEQPAPRSTATRPLDTAAEPGDEEKSPVEESGETASRLETLRLTPFARCSKDELAIVTALVRRLRTAPPARPDRRLVPGYLKESVDLRATARRAMKTQTDLVLPSWRHRHRQPRRVVMLLDVSRSMAVYSRLLLHFGYALASTRRGVEVVCFGTRVTRITGLLRSRQTARALETAAMGVLDWNGGTRIADAVGSLRSMRSVRGALRGSIVVICSDGLEQGDPQDLGKQMYLLSRACHQIIWVNPLAGDERYRPISGGMQAALPWIDRLMAGDTLAALEQVAVALGDCSLPATRPLSPGVRPRSRSGSAPG